MRNVKISLERREYIIKNRKNNISNISKPTGKKGVCEIQSYKGELHGLLLLILSLHIHTDLVRSFFQ